MKMMEIKAQIRRTLGFLLILELVIKIKIKAFVKRIFKELKDFWNIVLFLIFYLINVSPVIVGYLLFFITKNKWHLTYANLCIAFWAGPGTPLIPLCIVLALGTRKGIKKLKEVVGCKRKKKIK